VSLTDAGAEFLPWARDIMAEKIVSVSVIAIALGGPHGRPPAASAAS
jgi:DNA-binding transcriptional LysR family regulator